MRTSKYKLVLMLFTAGMFIVIATLSFLLYKHGPRVRLVSFDKNPSESSLNQGTNLTISFDRPLEQKDYTDQIAFYPEVNFTAQTSVQTITVTFRDNLKSDTEYLIKVGPDVYDQVGKRMRSAYETTVSTGLPSYAYLERNYGAQNAETELEADDANDHIKLAKLGEEPETVFSSSEISMFAANSDYVVVATKADLRDELHTIDLQTRETRTEDLRFGGRINNLSLSPKGKVALFTVSPDYDAVNPEDYEAWANLLQSLNLETGIATPLGRSEDEVLKATSINVDMDGQVALIQDSEKAFYAISPFNDYEPVQIGTHTETAGFNDNASEIIFRDEIDFARYDIASSKLNPVEAIVPGYVQSITNNTDKVYISSSTYFTGEPRSYITLLDTWDDKESTELWSNSDYAEETLREFALSYDESLIALQLNSETCRFDQVDPNSQCLQVHTVIYEPESKEVIKDFLGFDLVWLP